MKSFNLLAFCVSILGFWSASSLNAAQQWLPFVSDYSKPQGAVLVLSEDYGSGVGRDGFGSWVASGTAAITQQQDCIEVDVAGGSYITLSLPFEPRLSDYVIDVGLVGWERTTGGETATNAMWWLNSEGGSSALRHYWIAKEDTITAEFSGESIPFNQQTGYVVRLSSGDDAYNPAMILNFGGENSICYGGSKWGGTESSNFLRLYASSNGGSISKIAWIRVYADANTFDAPLSAVGEPKYVPMGRYNSPQGGELVFYEQYGKDYDGQGSWVAASGTTVIDTDPNEYVSIDVAAGSAKLPLGIELRECDYVMDICLKGWVKQGASTATNAMWWLSTGGTSKLQHRWTGTSNMLTAQYTNEEAILQENCGHIIRVSSAAWDYNPLLTVDFGGMEYQANGGYAWNGPAENCLQIYAASTGRSINDIAWIRIYTGVATTEAPLISCEQPSDIITPAYTYYAPPSSGYLAISEDYGMLKDGVGSWISNGCNTDLTLYSNSLNVWVSGSSAELPLPFIPRFENWTIDIGLVEWLTATPEGGTATCALWRVDSAKVGSKHNNTWIVRNNLDNEIIGEVNTSTIPFNPEKVQVVRISSSKLSGTASLILNDGAYYHDEENQWDGDAQSDPKIWLYAANGAQSHNNIAWIRVYKDVASVDAPLMYVDPQVCGDAGTVYLEADISGPDGTPDCVVDVYDLMAWSDKWLKSAQ